MRAFLFAALKYESLDDLQVPNVMATFDPEQRHGTTLLLVAEKLLEDKDVTWALRKSLMQEPRATVIFTSLFLRKFFSLYPREHTNQT